jgi:hypothetical protein
MFTSATLEEVAKDDRPFDLLDFLSIAQRCKVDFLPITWHDGLGPFDAGGSSNLSQSIVDLKTNFAFKRFIKRHNGRASGLRDIASEILTLRSEAIKSHPNFVDLLGVCWEFQQQTNSLEPVLVFPKAPLGNLRTFLHCRPNREVPFVTRLALCIDITRAIAVLHDSGKFKVKVAKFVSMLTYSHASFTVTSSQRISSCLRMAPGKDLQRLSILLIPAWQDRRLPRSTHQGPLPG